ncbi:hypothetical protein HYS48_04260 [Candidatus Woesearchaeota archaeon]|nr:hypothetical protein [Candidatus Woesearchaeota archaeon]
MGILGNKVPGIVVRAYGSKGLIKGIQGSEYPYKGFKFEPGQKVKFSIFQGSSGDEAIDLEVVE